jgi:chromosome segregation protein
MACRNRRAIERRLAGFKAERERLGAVNLRAEDELTEVKAKREGMTTERDDLTRRSAACARPSAR